jgi:hypothetical protein
MKAHTNVFSIPDLYTSGPTLTIKQYTLHMFLQIGYSKGLFIFPDSVIYRKLFNYHLQLAA